MTIFGSAVIPLNPYCISIVVLIMIHT